MGGLTGTRFRPGTAFPLMWRCTMPGMPAPVVLVFVGNAGSREAFRGFWEVSDPGRGHGGLLRLIVGPKARRAVWERTCSRRMRSQFTMRCRGFWGGTSRRWSYWDIRWARGLPSMWRQSGRSRGVALLAPFDRMCRVAEQRVWMPACLIPWVDHWNSVARVPELNAPVWVAHGLGTR